MLKLLIGSREPFTRLKESFNGLCRRSDIVQEWYEQIHPQGCVIHEQEEMDKWMKLLSDDTKVLILDSVETQVCKEDKEVLYRVISNASEYKDIIAYTTDEVFIVYADEVYMYSNNEWVRV